MAAYQITCCVMLRAATDRERDVEIEISHLRIKLPQAVCTHELTITRQLARK